MLIGEIITEARLGTLRVGEFSIAVSEHIMVRIDQRRIPILDIDRVLKRLPVLKDRIASLEDNQEFWVYDQSLELSLGMRKFTNTNLLLSTAIHGSPRNRDNVIVLTL